MSDYNNQTDKAGIPFSQYAKPDDSGTEKLQGEQGAGYFGPAAVVKSPGWKAKVFTSLSNTVVALKAANVDGGKLGGYVIVGSDSDWIYVQLFDAAPGDVVLGTTVPTHFLAVPPGGVLDTFPQGAGIEFNTAISVAATGSPTGNDAPADNLVASLNYV